MIDGVAALASINTVSTVGHTYEKGKLSKQGNPIVGPAQQAYEKLEPGKYSWGSISVWAWGTLQLLEYVLTLIHVDKNQIMISGHSRNGKTALLAGALDD